MTATEDPSRRAGSARDRGRLRPAGGAARRTSGGTSGRGAERSSDDEYRGGTGPIQDVLRSIIRARGLHAPRRDSRIFEALREVVAPSLRDRLVPVRFRNGELVVEVASSAQLHELRSFTGEEIRRRLNQHLDPKGQRGEVVRSLAFKLRGRR